MNIAIIECPKCHHVFGSKKNPKSKIQSERPNCSVCSADINYNYRGRKKK